MGEKKKLSARQIGRNLITVIGGKKLSRKTETDKEIQQIHNKIELYNKKPSKERLEEIKDWFSASHKEKEKKEMIKKGVKKEIKKEKKVTARKTKASEVSEPEAGEELVRKVKEAHAAGTMTDQQIKDLQKLLAKEEAERASRKEQEKNEEEQQKSTPVGKRTGER